MSTEYRGVKVQFDDESVNQNVSVIGIDKSVFWQVVEEIKPESRFCLEWLLPRHPEHLYCPQFQIAIYPKQGMG